MAFGLVVDVLLGCGEGYGEATALARFAFEPDPSAVALDDGAGDREAQASALADSLGGGVGLVKTVEDCLVLCFGDADSGVADSDLDEAAANYGSDGNTSTVGREFHGIAEEI